MSENTINSALRAMGYDTKPRSAGMGSGRWRVVRWVSQVYGAMML